MKAQFLISHEEALAWLKTKGIDASQLDFTIEVLPGAIVQVTQPVSLVSPVVVEPPAVKPITPPVGAFPIDPKFFVNTLATIFGLNYDGSIDAGDNGEGAFVDLSTAEPYSTRDPKLVGCSIPIPMFREMLGGDKQAVSAGKFKVWIEGFAQHVQIVDLGPGRDGKLLEDRYLDRTYGLCKAMGSTNNIRVNYAVIGPDGRPMEIKGLEGPKLKP
jgi:hypothetical protein